MKKKIVAVLLLVLLGIFAGGCGIGTKNENTKAGMEAVENMEYEAALQCFEAAREAGEEERTLRRGEGLALMGLTRYEEAAAAFEAALSASDGRVDSMDVDMNYYLATSYYKMGDTARAIHVYDAILALKENEKDAYYLRGIINTQLGNMDDALLDFDKTLSLDSRDYDRLIRIYSILVQYGYKESGQSYLKKAMESGTRYMTNFEKGRISYYLEDYDNARTYLEKAREDNGYEAVLFLGKTHEILGEYNYAISVYNSYLESGNSSAEIMNQMGLCKLKMGDTAGALEAFQTAMNTEDNAIMQTLRMNEIIAYEYLGEFKKAAVLLGNYIQNYPDDEEAAREYEFLRTR